MPAAFLTRISVLAMTLSLTAQQSPVETRAIELAQRIPVSRLEAGLPRQTLVQWFTRAAGPGAKLTWEVDDCGEQSGDPEIDRGRDFPMCVAAVASLSNGRKAIVSVVMGTFGKGIVGPPQLMMVNILTAGRVDFIPKLRDLPARIKAGR